MEPRHFLRSHCKLATPDGKCCESFCLEFESKSSSKIRSATSERKRVYSSSNSATKKTLPKRRLLETVLVQEHQTSAVDTPVSFLETSSSVNVSTSLACSCEYMSTRSRSSSLIESELEENNTLSKTGYTYAKSRSYRQQVTPDRIIPPPNMSRSRVSGAGFDLSGGPTFSRDGRDSRASSVGSQYSTHSYYLRSGTGSPGSEENRDESPPRISPAKRKYPVSPSTKAAFEVPRGLDRESDSSPSPTGEIPRRRSVTPLVGGTTAPLAFHGNGKTYSDSSARLGSIEEADEQVTIIRRIITICRVYNERIIRYVTNTVAPPTIPPPDVASSASHATAVNVPFKKKRGWLFWFGWLLLPLLLASVFFLPASKKDLVEDQPDVNYPGPIIVPAPVPLVSPGDDISESQRTWVLSVVNSVLDSRLSDVISGLNGRLLSQESGQVSLEQNVETKLQVLMDLLNTVHSDLEESKASLTVLSSQSSSEQTRLSQIENSVNATMTESQSSSEGLLALRNSIENLQVELEAAKSCCKNNEAIIGMSKAISEIQNQHQRFEGLIASLSGEQQATMEGKVSGIRDEFKRQLHLIEATLRAEADSTRTVLMEEVAAKVATVAAASAALHLKDYTLGVTSGVSEEFVAAAIAEALEKYDADKIGMADFALESAGGEVASIRCTQSYTKGSGSLRLFGIPLWYPTNNPRIAIQRGVNPGECWAFEGPIGYLVVKLARPVKVTAVTIEHIPKIVSVTDTVDTAPQNFSVYGLHLLQDPSPYLLGNFTYDTDKPPLQTFYLTDQDNLDAFPFIELRILSNHGNKDYTCLYRFRVHGVPASASAHPIYVAVTAGIGESGAGVAGNEVSAGASVAGNEESADASVAGNDESAGAGVAGNDESAGVGVAGNDESAGAGDTGNGEPGAGVAGNEASQEVPAETSQASEDIYESDAF